MVELAKRRGVKPEPVEVGAELLAEGEPSGMSFDQLDLPRR